MFRLMGSMPDRLPDAAGVFWPVLSFGILIGIVAGLFLAIIVVSIFKGKP